MAQSPEIGGGAELLPVVRIRGRGFARHRSLLFVHVQRGRAHEYQQWVSLLRALVAALDLAPDVRAGVHRKPANSEV